MAVDAITIFVSAIIATLLREHLSLMGGARGFWHGTLIHGRSVGVIPFFLCFYALSLIVVSRHLNLYSPTHIYNILQEQRLNVQACLTSGLLLTGTLYLFRAEDISRSIVLVTVGLVTLF